MPFTGWVFSTEDRSMSAYVSGRGNSIFALNANLGGAPEPEASSPTSSLSSHLTDQISPLPEITHELERYFIIARQLETALAHEKRETRKYKEHLQQLRYRHAKFATEIDNTAREFKLKEEEYQSQLTSYRKAEKGLHDQVSDFLRQIEAFREEKCNSALIAREVEANLAQEKLKVRNYKEHLRQLQQRHARMSAEVEDKMRQFTLREERLKSQLSTSQQAEKRLHDQVSDLCRQIATLQEDKNRSEVEKELARANLDHFRTKELSSVSALRSELSRYQLAWGQIVARDQKTKQTVQEFWESKKKIEELNESLQAERKQKETLEERLNKERREKQLALSCLHTAESRLAQATTELEEIRCLQMPTPKMQRSIPEHNHSLPQVEENSLELNF